MLVKSGFCCPVKLFGHVVSNNSVDTTLNGCVGHEHMCLCVCERVFFLHIYLYNLRVEMKTKHISVDGCVCSSFSISRSPTFTNILLKIIRVLPCLTHK